MLLNGVFGIVSERRPTDILVVSYCGKLGLGVRALIAIDGGAVLDHFDGSIGSELQQHSLQISPGQHISETRFIGYLSHSCDPNCQLDMKNFELVALRDVEACSLLTIDYAATEERLYRQFSCLCGSGNCRGWVTGHNEQISSEGVSYLSTRVAGVLPE